MQIVGQSHDVPVWLSIQYGEYASSLKQKVLASSFMKYFCFDLLENTDP